MNRILKKTLALAALFCLTLGLAGCQSGAGKTLEQAGTALKNKDSGAFLSQFDMQAYAAHEFANLKQSNQLLSGLDSMGKMLGLGSQVNDLINSIIDLQGRYTDTFTRTVASGELQDQCSKSKTPDCPWVPEALASAEVRELNETAAVAKVTTPANMTSWIACASTTISGRSWARPRFRIPPKRSPMTRLPFLRRIRKPSSTFLKRRTPLPALRTSDPVFFLKTRERPPSDIRGRPFAAPAASDLKFEAESYGAVI